MGGQSAAAPVQNAAVQYAPAQIAVQARESEALRRAGQTKPVAYNYDVNKANQMADTLGKYSSLHNLNALKEISPEAYAGMMSGIKTVSGGTAGDDVYLRNQALRAGLENANQVGATIAGPGSAGAANVANIFGKNLLAYQQQRAGQQLALGQSLVPDASINPGQGVSAYMGNDARAADAQNNYNNFLNSLTFTGIQNENNNLNQNQSASQSAFNAQAQADAQANGASQGMLGNILGAAGTGGGGIVGGIYGGPAGAALGSGVGGLAGKAGGSLLS